MRRILLAIGALVAAAAAASMLYCSPSNVEVRSRPASAASSVSVIEVRDVHGRSLTIGNPSDSTMVMFVVGPDKEDAVQPIANELAVRFRDADSLVMVSIADLRSLWQFERPFARGHLRDSRHRTIRRINRHLESKGVRAIDDLDSRLYVVADHQGEIADHFELANPNSQITSLVFDRSGLERGRFDPERDLESLVQALAASLAP